MSKPYRNKSKGLNLTAHYDPSDSPVQLPIKGPRELSNTLRGWNLVVQDYTLQKGKNTIQMTFSTVGMAPVKYYTASKKGFANYATNTWNFSIHSAATNGRY